MITSNFEKELRRVLEDSIFEINMRCFVEATKDSCIEAQILYVENFKELKIEYRRKKRAFRTVLKKIFRK